MPINDQTHFNYDRFLSLAGLELANYVEPFLTHPKETISESIYQLLENSILDFDTYHTVYALEICMQLKPTVFVGRAVEFLSHTDSSVCSTAYRLIKNIPRHLMPAELILKIADTPTVDLFATEVRSGRKIFLGTNEKFIRELVG